jgi:beta-galactosidase
MSTPVSRRYFLEILSAVGLTCGLGSQLLAEPKAVLSDVTRLDGVPVPDEGWSLWLDRDAKWENDEIYLPDQVVLSKLPAHPPTGGWDSLYSHSSGAGYPSVKLPVTVEQCFWGEAGLRPYTPEEYRYAADDPVPQNGAYRGVSWFSRVIDIPQSMAGKRILLNVRGARMRAEVYLNEKLVGYSIMEELPFTCDLSEAARPGGANQLAIRITNPGGRYDWVDGSTISWGKVNFYRSHGFGGLDRGLSLRAVPQAGHIDDLWVLNKPAARTVTAKAKLQNGAGSQIRFEAIDLSSGKVIAAAAAVPSAANSPDGADFQATIRVPDARLWDLDSPNLYLLRATQSLPGSEHDVRHVIFGFRWYAPEGLGKDAIFRLNGRRIKIYTSISWGFWGHNGLFPTPELAEREVAQAKRLNLNCLNFHRNVGKEEVLSAHDRLGLLRYMEPGGGRLSIGKLPVHVEANSPGILMQSPKDGSDQFSQRFMLEKCRYMVRAFRSHPSLIQYTLQNELGADLRNPASTAAIEIMHAEDASRCVVLNDGFSPPPRSAAQAWFEPYSETMHRSDREPWGGWWNNHQGSGDHWYDRFYVDSQHFTYNQPTKDVLVEFGEMEGCAVADNHSLMVRQLEARQFGGNGTSYDLTDHKEIAAAYDRFLDRWGFRGAFPSTEELFHALGNKCYESWQQYLENIRICDAVDFAAISGWESTSIENHSGIVDNLRNFKGDPDLIAGSLFPVRPVAKQHALTYATGKSAVFDLYLLNDTGKMPEGKLRLDVADPTGRRVTLNAWDMPALTADRFSYTVATNYEAPAFETPGIYIFYFTAESLPDAVCNREIWVAQAEPALPRKLRVGISGVIASFKEQLASIQGLNVQPFTPGAKYDLIIASGAVPGSKLDRQIGEETGLEAPPVKGALVVQQTPGQLTSDVLAAVRADTPLLAIVPDDFLADGVARQLADLGAFTYRGQVGDTRAPWMGNWMFVREHATFAHLPANRVLGVHYQAPGKAANGLLIERAPGGAEPEVIMGYSRDHDRNVGAASFVCRVGTAPLLFHRAPDFSAPLQKQWLVNALGYLATQSAR